MILYHGSDHIIEVPAYNGSKRTNDYGYGFYTTESLELAKEWACSDNKDGFANSYETDLDGLRILNLNGPEYSILNWLAVLTHYRRYWQNGSISEDAKDYLQRHFFIDPTPYDVIIGYRADDSYFTFAQDFVSNTIPLSKLSEAMRLGKLGEQIVFKSEASFSRIHFINAEPASAAIYYEKKTARDRNARREYRKTKKSEDTIHGLYMLDIMREGEPLMTASGGYFIRGEVNRNKRAPQCGVAPIEVAERMAIRAYDETYLPGAQNILGHAIDFAVMSLDLDPDTFGNALAVSQASKQFASGNPKYVAGMNGCDLARIVLSEINIPFTDTEDAMYMDKSPEYWSGWALAFYQWYSGRSFMDILSAVPLSGIIRMYPVYHEMDIQQFVDRMDEILKEAYPATRLKTRRVTSGMSQSELAADSGVALRQIQLFEQRQRDINNAAAITLLQLSKSLHCRMEDLIEPA